MGSNRGKSSIAKVFNNEKICILIGYQKLFGLLGAPIIFSPTISIMHIIIYNTNMNKLIENKYVKCIEIRKLHSAKISLVQTKCKIEINALKILYFTI